MKHYFSIAVLSLTAALTLSACGATSGSTTSDTGTETGSDSGGSAGASVAATGYPSGHIHGMSVDPGTNRILLATHDGLFEVSQDSAVQVGPTIDLMGFTADAEGVLFASGHPGPGTDLPNPVGLITSTDEGRTWKPVSRQGETDFHSLAATDDGLIGYEGGIITSPNGLDWTVKAEDLPAYNLAGAADGTVLATTEEGLRRSEDSGATWAAVPEAPLLVFTTFAGNTAVGVTPEGVIHTSPDAGLTWQQRGSIEGDPAAIAAVSTNDGTDRIWVATAEGILVSTDNGATFTPFAAP